VKRITFLWIILAAIPLLALVAWERKAAVTAQYIGQRLGVSVTIDSMDVSRSGAKINHLAVRNPSGKGFRVSPALTIDTIEIDTTLKQLSSSPLTIDRFELDNMKITLEYSESGPTNWGYILNTKRIGLTRRTWQIRSLIFTNLMVQTIDPAGTIQEYPSLARLEFNDLSNETGIPVDDIKKAILNAMGPKGHGVVQRTE